MKSLTEFCDEFEAMLLTFALDCCDWNQSKAAEMLGINRTTLIGRMIQYDIKDLYADETVSREPTSCYRWHSLQTELRAFYQGGLLLWGELVNARLKKQIKELVS